MTLLQFTVTCFSTAAQLTAHYCTKERWPHVPVQLYINSMHDDVHLTRSTSKRS